MRWPWWRKRPAEEPQPCTSESCEQAAEPDPELDEVRQRLERLERLAEKGAMAALEFERNTELRKR